MFHININIDFSSINIYQIETTKKILLNIFSNILKNF